LRQANLERVDVPSSELHGTVLKDKSRCARF